MCWHIHMYFYKTYKYLKTISKQTEKCLTYQTLVNELKFANLINLWSTRFHFFIVIIVQRIKRSSKLWKIIVVACGAHKNLPCIIMYTQLIIPLTGTPYQIRSSSSFLKKPNLTGHLNHILQLTIWLLIRHRQDAF